MGEKGERIEMTRLARSQLRRWKLQTKLSIPLSARKTSFDVVYSNVGRISGARWLLRSHSSSGGDGGESEKDMRVSSWLTHTARVFPVMPRHGEIRLSRDALGRGTRARNLENGKRLSLLVRARAASVPRAVVHA
jgi:hypothetical protein